MKTASISEVKRHFAAYLDDRNAQPVVVTRHGKPIAVIVAVCDEDAIDNAALAYQAQFWQMLDDASRRIAQRGGIEHAAFWQVVESDHGE